MPAFEYLHFPRWNPRDKEFPADSLQDFLNVYGRSNWELVYLAKLSGIDYEIVFKQEF